VGEWTSELGKIVVHLADSDRFSRSGIQSVLCLSSHVTVGELFDSVEETIQGIDTNAPDVLLVCDTLRTQDLLGDLSRIHRSQPSTPIVFLASSLQAQQIAQVYNSGCSGYISKSSILDSDFASALNLVAAGFTLFARAQDKRPFPVRSTLMQELSVVLGEIDERDRQIVISVASGMRNSEIAAALHVSQGTVKQRLGVLLDLFGVTNRVQLAVVAAEAGLVASVEITEADEI